MALRYKQGPLEGLDVLSCRGEMPFDRHLHDGYVLWLNSESGEKYKLRGETRTLEPGDVSIIEPGVIHANQPCDPARRHLRSFYFSAAFLRQLTRTLFGSQGRLALSTTVLNRPDVWRDLVGLHETILAGRRDAASVEDLLMQVFADLLVVLNPLAGREPGRIRPERRVSRVIDFFHAHLDQNVPLNQLAAMVGCTGYHLIRLFKAQSGVSPHAYLVQLRLEHARNLILSRTPIADAAVRSGFSDQSHLTRAFGKRYGLTPSQYLRQRSE